MQAVSPLWATDTPTDMEGPYSDIITTLAAMRKQRGWTQAHVAQEIGISQPTFSQWERGGVRPSAWQLVEWGDALGFRVQLAPSGDTSAKLARLLELAAALPVQQLDDLVAVAEGLPRVPAPVRIAAVDLITSVAETVSRESA